MNKPKLPQLPPETPEVGRISPNLDRSRTLPEAVRKQLAFEPAPENRISEAQFNRRLHPLVNAMKKILECKMSPADQQPRLDIRVSIGTRNRALRLLSALFYAFEERGFGIKSMPREKEGGILRFPSSNDEVQGRRGLPRHELLYQFRILDLPVIGQQVRFAQNHLRTIVEFDGQVRKFQRHCGQKFLRNLQPTETGVGD